MQEEERGRLARDLHDDIGQALTALKIQLESLARAGRADRARAHRGDASRPCSTRSSACASSRSACVRSQLDDLGLAAALRSHLDRQASVGGLHAALRCRGCAARTLEPDTETACFRVAQEAITNVLRHARARNFWVRLFTAGGRLALSVRDDGRGFDLDAVRAPRARAGASLGLVGMEERMALAGGSFELRSAPGQGTVLLATFPLITARKGAGGVMIRVLLADDHALVRAGIRSLLNAMAEVEVVGEAASGEEALELADREQPDVVLMDIAMKGITGLEAAARMRERYPGVRVVILSMHSGEEYVLQALRAGAVGLSAEGRGHGRARARAAQRDARRELAQPGGVAPGGRGLRAAQPAATRRPKCSPRASARCCGSSPAARAPRKSPSSSISR